MNDHGNGADETPSEPGSNVAGTPAKRDDRPASDVPDGAIDAAAGSAGAESAAGASAELPAAAGEGSSSAAGEPAPDTDPVPAVTSEEQTGPIPRVPAAVSPELAAGTSTAQPHGADDLLLRRSAGAHVASGKARRSPWNRRRDWLIVVAIAAVVAAGITVVAASSDNLHTSRAVAAAPQALPAPPPEVPGAMKQLWQAPSSATPVPIGQSDTVTTADGGEVAGRDPITGQIRWHYTRDNLQLCTVDTAWGRVNAVYHKSMGCSEVTQLDPATGRITAQRNGDAELGTRLVSDGSHVTTTGKHLLDTWRDDLVKSMEYGKVPFLVNANKQPRTNCTYGTVAAANDKVGVIERCPGDRGDRLTVYKATAEHEDEPQVVYTALLAGSRARVIAMSGDLVGVLLPEQQLYVVYGADGTQKAAYPMDLPADDLKSDPVGGTEATTRTAAAIYWYSGSKTVALSRDDLSPRWTLDRTLGPGITFAGQLVVPIRGGLAVLNETNGSTLRTVGIDRGSYSGPVQLTALGPVLLEQRGPVVAALR
ncbi:hypothetical protein [Amycolatopsis benzoatilytica]|uniref:Rv3212 family protein n=1 Tax=Amycolatopsis benzoatilytica TaxID=346045 RepID=UPI0003694CCE|nr:hypothetical protein [Amycolatopsis benzoatilytica]